MATVSAPISADSVVVVCNANAPRQIIKVYAYDSTGSTSLTVYDAASTTIVAQKQIAFLNLTSANVLYELDFGEPVDCDIGIELEIAGSGTKAWVVWK